MHPLEAKIRAVRRRLRWWLLMEALARLMVWVLGGAVLFGLADYTFRFQELGLRLLLGLGFFALVAWRLYRLARSPAWKRIPELALALRLEQCFPILADRLASSLCFLREPAEDPTSGSPALRQLLIAQTVQDAMGMDFRRALDPRPIRRKLWGEVIICIVMGGLALADPNAARIALARLVMPFSATAWPQRTHLILVPRVERIARGQPFELRVEEASGRMPEDLRIHYRLETPEGLQEQTEPVRLVGVRSGDGRWHRVGQVRREGLQQPFWYRLTGGDDTRMEWIRVEVLEPPSLVSCQVRLIPPEYTGLPPETAGQWIRALVGTRVEMTGRADRPLRAAVLITDDDQQHPAQILPDEHSFQIGIDSPTKSAPIGIDSPTKSAPIGIDSPTKSAQKNPAPKTSSGNPSHPAHNERHPATTFHPPASPAKNDQHPPAPTGSSDAPAKKKLSSPATPGSSADPTGLEKTPATAPGGDTPDKISSGETDHPPSRQVQVGSAQPGHSVSGQVPSSSGSTGESASRQGQVGSGAVARSRESGAGLIIRESGRWRLWLMDQEGLEQEVAGWEVRAVPDQPPSLSVQSPPVLTHATPTAVLPIRARARDDLGVYRVVLWAAVGQGGQIGSVQPPSPAPSGTPEAEMNKLPPSFRSWTLYEGPKPAPKQPKPFSALQEELHPRTTPVEYAWDLSSLQAKPGTEIVFYLEASDYAGQSVSSPPYRIVLLTAEQFLDRLNGQQQAMLGELAQWLQKQRSVHDPLAELQKHFADGQPLDQRCLDRLRSLELTQRQLHDQLAQGPESILQRLQSRLEELEQNHLGQTEIRRRLEYLRSGLARLEKDHLLPIGQEFIYAIKAGQTALETQASQSPPQEIRPPAALLDSLRQIREGQQEVIKSLDSWLARFRPGLQTQRFGQEIAGLIRDQEALGERIRQVAQTTLTKELRELAPQETVALQDAAQQQTDLARRMERLQQEMADTLRDLHPVDPVAGQLLAEAVRYAEQTAPAASMTAAAEDIRQNRMGRLLQTVPSILQHLRHLAELLGHRHEQTAGRLLPMLRQTEEALAEYIRRQQEILNLLQLTQQAKPNDRSALLQQAAGQQEGLIGPTEKLLEKMEQVWAAQPAQAIRSALEAMREAVRSARQAQAVQAIQAAQTALQALWQARQLLAQQQMHIQSALLGQQLAQLREALPDLHARQQQIHQETIQLEQARKQPGPWTPQQQVRLADLARQQETLQAETASWAEKLAEQAVLQMALADTAHHMLQAAQQLAHNQTGPAAQQAQQEALSQLRLLMEALGQEGAAIPLAKPAASPSGQPPSPSGARKLVSAAELKLLRLWQQAIHQQTVQFHQTFGDRPPDRPDVEAQYQALRQAQARLAQMVQQILQSDSSEEKKP